MTTTQPPDSDEGRGYSLVLQALAVVSIVLGVGLNILISLGLVA